jgi:hypothetical protein
MNTPFDPLGVVAIVAVLAALTLVFRAVSGGRMKPALRWTLAVIVGLVLFVFLWNVLATME